MKSTQHEVTTRRQAIVFHEYFEKPLFMLLPWTGAVGATEYDVEYTIDDEQQQKLLKLKRRNKRK